MIEILAAIGRLNFVFAKTMPENPHEYTIKATDNEVDFDRPVQCRPGSRALGEMGQGPLPLPLPGRRLALLDHRAALQFHHQSGKGGR
jgi:hypothetical protein